MDLQTDQLYLMYGDCLERMREIPDNHVDAVVTDPPYGIGFMGKHWDKGVPDKTVFREMLRVSKPGGHLLAFCGTRMFHRMACSIEDGGFDIRDTIAWVYATGFPKSLNVGKAVASITGPASPEAAKWDGWATALKPAFEPITLARKPFEGTVANNVLSHGTGALNIDDSRIGEYGKYPTNFIHDGSDEVLECFPQRYCSEKKAGWTIRPSDNQSMEGGWSDSPRQYLPSSEGSAARFFYCAKVSKSERDYGLQGDEKTAGQRSGRKEGSAGITAFAGTRTPSKNFHPTVKPIKLMKYLITLITPRNGVVLDPFMGSGSTGIAADELGFNFIGIEKDSQYFGLAAARILGVK